MWTVHTGRGFRNYAPKAETLAKRREKARKTLEAAGLAEAFRIFEEWPEGGYTTYEERTIADIVARLARWGNVSEKALAYVGTLLAKIPEREAEKVEREAARAAEYAAAEAVPVTEGRTMVEGEVLTVKEKATRFGTVLKMLVKTPAGYKLWGTVPAALSAVERGAVVAFEAAVERSEKDAKFGFFARPTKARVVKAAATEERAAA